MRQAEEPIAKSNSLVRSGLRLLNIRPEESGRAFLMFLFYTLTSVGILWLEVSVAALFLGKYGAASLPWIYIASAAIGSVIGFAYSTLQRFLSLRQVLVLTAGLMGLPLFLFGMDLQAAVLGGYTIFLARLWLEAIHVVNELNTSITANQLFTIREVRRAYPLISSGVLAADVVSGFSLPVLRGLIGLPNVIMASGVMLLIGAGILLYLVKAYKPFFPDSSRRRNGAEKQDFTAVRLRGSLWAYVSLVVAFFVMVQVLAVLLDFQYLSQIELSLDVRIEKIADFMAMFSAILGMVEMVTQWFISGRVIERLGVFWIAAAPPALLSFVSILSLCGVLNVFHGTVALKFVDELLRYTLVASIGPVLFHPIPNANRSRIQSMVRGIAEPLATGLTGVGMLGTIWLLKRVSQGSQAANQSRMFLLFTALTALLWIGTVWFLRSKYVEVLVLSAEQGGQLSLSKADMRGFMRGIKDSLGRSQDESEKKSCINLLAHHDPKSVGEVLSPLLPSFSSALQYQSLQAMLSHPNPAYLGAVKDLVAAQRLRPDVLAMALRFIWHTDETCDCGTLENYMQEQVNPAVRGLAAALTMRYGNEAQKAKATSILRRMLTHQQEKERVMGCRVLGEAVYLQSLRLYITKLLADESLRVRCAMLEAIAATQLDDYYDALVRGFHYPSTRDAAKRSLIRLQNDALPLLINLAADPYKSDGVRYQAWLTVGEIGSMEATRAIVNHLMTAWGATRRGILRVLLRLPNEAGIDAVADVLGRSGVETMMNQEILFLAHLYASLEDLKLESMGLEAALFLQRALKDAEKDAIESLFLLMQFLYEPSNIQAAAMSLQSNARESVAQGLEILDNTIQISSKIALLNILDRQPDVEKLNALEDFVPYEPMSPSDRLRHLVDLRHLLPDWALACCFHLASAARWSVPGEPTLACLRSPTGFVREAVLHYLQVASPRALPELLPSLEKDSDPLVSAQVQQLVAKLGVDSRTPSPAPQHRGSRSRQLAEVAGLN
jgi:HEAT repeat protein